MAKKQEKASYQGDPGDEHIEKVQVMETPKPKKNKWELKDRTYLLTKNMSPLTLTLKSRGLFWFDDEKGYQREVKYCKNQKTVFVDEMQGPQNMEHIVFYEGVLTVPKENVMLQKLLSLYHPMKDRVYEEWRPEVVAQDEVNDIEIEIEALTTAVNLDVDLMEAVMRVELGSEVSNMSSKELKRDTLLYAKQNPVLFLDLVNDDNVQLRNLGIKAVEKGIVSLSEDQRTFTWSSNNRKLMNVPFDEHPYSALAAWFKTDEGMEIFSNIEKQLK
tara:strand:- start:2725 stop:3543 length:819 start_codon:yes stop_codon:yes gene_type:complete